MPGMKPTDEQVAEMMRANPEESICLVNLLKFRDRAEYAESVPEAKMAISGSEAFSKYMDGFRGVIEQLGGKLIYSEKARRFIIGEGDWDRVAVIYLPARKFFLVMQQMPEFQAVKHHRDAGLLHQDLTETAANAL